MLTETDVRELAGFKGEDAPVTSVYLDVDGSRHVRRHWGWERVARQMCADLDEVAGC